MALPGFIEYLFYGYEQRDRESGFFNAQQFEHSEACESDSQMLADPGFGGESNDDSYQQEMLGIDLMTGKAFTRERKRKPMRYYIPDLIGGRKNTDTIQ